MKPIFPVCFIPTMAQAQLCQRPMIFNNPTIETKHSKRKFSPEEDEKLAFIVSQCGESNWKRIAEQMGTRNCRQCRERWKNYLCPNVCKEPWTHEEDELIVEKVNEIGTKWSTIAKFIKGRSDNTIKNRWYCCASIYTRSYSISLKIFHSSTCLHC